MAKRIPAHPGKLLKREMAARKLSANRLAIEIGVPANRITAIVNAKRAVTPETALRLGVYFSTGPEVWANMQLNHDIGVAREKFEAEIKRTVRAA